ncbi:prenyltransferase [Malassezia pachydermatis]|uniref:(2E,6E)-farnesyl diphosphate synthase n=1 Tax=Malassezia pachydermatis TaxID=77020 RepID=A0A0M9VP31_9BASI|nr:geranylgeranyl diphosphate type iii [Malassezia pachydermatis]KOS13999.1 geranylgeranyl diphosphate type iii [Malassezia pachydermatis]
MDEAQHAWYEDVRAYVDMRGPWPEAHEKAVSEPYRYLDAHPGKELRSQLIDAFNVWIHVPPTQLEYVKCVVRRLHTASLLMDDVEDNSDLRRGVPAAHTIYGVPQTVNTANYVYFQVLSDIVQQQPDAMPAMIDELVRLHRGQGMDLFWRDSLQCPTEQEYVDMVVNKTGGLFRIALRLMLASAPTPPTVDLAPLANVIGIYFQIRDDYVNLQSTQLAQHKGFCEDLTEGKFSFPILHAIRTAEPDRTLLHILRQRTTHIETKKYAIEYMERVTHSFSYTRTVLQALAQQAEDELTHLEHVLGANPALHSILDVLARPC